MPHFALVLVFFAGAGLLAGCGGGGGSDSVSKCNPETDVSCSVDAPPTTVSAASTRALTTEAPSSSVAPTTRSAVTSVQVEPSTTPATIEFTWSTVAPTTAVPVIVIQPSSTSAAPKTIVASTESPAELAREALATQPPPDELVAAAVPEKPREVLYDNNLFKRVNDISKTGKVVIGPGDDTRFIDVVPGVMTRGPGSEMRPVVIVPFEEPTRDTSRWLVADIRDDELEAVQVIVVEKDGNIAAEMAEGRSKSGYADWNGNLGQEVVSAFPRMTPNPALAVKGLRYENKTSAEGIKDYVAFLKSVSKGMQTLHQIHQESAEQPTMEAGFDGYLKWLETTKHKDSEVQAMRQIKQDYANFVASMPLPPGASIGSPVQEYMFHLKESKNAKVLGQLSAIKEDYAEYLEDVNKEVETEFKEIEEEAEEKAEEEVMEELTTQRPMSNAAPTKATIEPWSTAASTSALPPASAPALPLAPAPALPPPSAPAPPPPASAPAPPPPPPAAPAVPGFAEEPLDMQPASEFTTEIQLDVPDAEAFCRNTTALELITAIFQEKVGPGTVVHLDMCDTDGKTDVVGRRLSATSAPVRMHLTFVTQTHALDSTMQGVAMVDVDALASGARERGLKGDIQRVVTPHGVKSTRVATQVEIPEIGGHAGNAPFLLGLWSNLGTKMMEQSSQVLSAVACVVALVGASLAWGRCSRRRQQSAGKFHMVPVEEQADAAAAAGGFQPPAQAAANDDNGADDSDSEVE